MGNSERKGKNRKMICSHKAIFLLDNYKRSGVFLKRLKIMWITLITVLLSAALVMIL